MLNLLQEGASLNFSGTVVMVTDESAAWRTDKGLKAKGKKKVSMGKCSNWRVQYRDRGDCPHPFSSRLVRLRKNRGCAGGQTLHRSVRYSQGKAWNSEMHASNSDSPYFRKAPPHFPTRHCCSPFSKEKLLALFSCKGQSLPLQDLDLGLA